MCLLPLCYEIILDGFSAVIPKWPISFITSIFFFPPLLPTRRREVSELLPCRHCLYILSHLRPQMLLFGSCPVIICDLDCLDFAPANISLVQPTSLTWVVIFYLQLVSTRMTLWAAVPVPRQRFVVSFVVWALCAHHAQHFVPRFQCLRPGISVLGEHEALSTVQFVSVCSGFLFSETQEPKSRSLSRMKGLVHLVVCLHHQVTRLQER